MSLFNAKKLGYLTAGVLVTALFAAQGCSSSDDSQAAPNGGASGSSNPNAGAGGKANPNAGAGGKANPGGGEANGGTGNSENMGGEAGTIGEAGAPGEAGATSTCNGADGCYSCVPKTSLQFANHCVTGGCPATFDNTTLTKLNLVGTL